MALLCSAACSLPLEQLRAERGAAAAGRAVLRAAALTLRG